MMGFRNQWNTIVGVSVGSMMGVSDGNKLAVVVIHQAIEVEQDEEVKAANAARVHATSLTTSNHQESAAMSTPRMNGRGYAPSLPTE